MRAAERVRKIRPRSYFVFFGLFAAVVFLSHFPWLDVPYFWDETGQFIPQALDFLRDGALIPRSVSPGVHPPGLTIYLAAAWKVLGYRLPVTRCAMLLLAAFSILAAFLLAIELLRNARGMSAFLAVALLAFSPLFFAQALMAQMDAPAMLFTALALWLFLKERPSVSAAACLALVLVKETGVIVPLVFAAHLVIERRRRDALWFLAPIAAVAAWLGFLAHAVGYWAGNPSFAEYNLRYPLHPVRLAVNLLRRLYYLGFANFHWIGLFAILFAWRTTTMFRNRSWRVAWSLVAAHVTLVTLLGGAVLERYLLPVMPVLYAAMAAGLSLFPRRPRLICSAALLAGIVACNFINPPYPFPYEDNLAFADFARLQSDAAGYLLHWYPDARITTTWPMTAELSHPELGYVNRPMAVEPLPRWDSGILDSLDWSRVQVLVAYSRDWEPRLNLLSLPLVEKLWRRFYGYSGSLSEEQMRARIPFPVETRMASRGQWLDIYVNPAIPRSGPQPAFRADAIPMPGTPKD
jgi:hypothetical protein